MFGYTYPFYRSPYIGGFGYGYPTWNYGGYGNNYGGINAIGSAIANQNLFNTGSMVGVNQIATPTVIY